MFSDRRQRSPSGGFAAHTAWWDSDRGRGRGSNRRLTVGLFIPTRGASGIWGPSCRACATLAAREINEAGGVRGREIALRIEDAGGDPERAAARASQLVEADEIQAIVGMHISSFRQSLVRSIGGRIPYIYTPLYEGGERTPGVFAIGETPAGHLFPAINWLAERYSLRRWVLLGNDYVWPRITHALAKRYFLAGGGEVLGERYLPFGIEDYGEVIDWIAALNPDAVLLSLVGQDSVAFNRVFGSSPSARKILRYSCAVEENILLGIGDRNTDGLFAAAAYFGNVRTRRNECFKERYYNFYGDSAPTLNAIGQSLYEGVYFLSALLSGTGGEDWRRPTRPIVYGGARGAIFGTGKRSVAPIFLAEARGNTFDIVAEFGLR